MLKEKTLVSPDIELGFTPAEPNTIGDGQKTGEKTDEDITDKCAKYVSGAPDGGFKAWSVIVASMLTTFCTLGYVNSSWGIFQEYYERVLLFNKSPSTMISSGRIHLSAWTFDRTTIRSGTFQDPLFHR